MQNWCATADQNRCERIVRGGDCSEKAPFLYRSRTLFYTTIQQQIHADTLLILYWYVFAIPTDTILGIPSFRPPRYLARVILCRYKNIQYAIRSHSSCLVSPNCITTYLCVSQNKIRIPFASESQQYLDCIKEYHRKHSLAVTFSVWNVSSTYHTPYHKRDTIVPTTQLLSPNSTYPKRIVRDDMLHTSTHILPNPVLVRSARRYLISVSYCILTDLMLSPDEIQNQLDLWLRLTHPTLIAAAASHNWYVNDSVSIQLMIQLIREWYFQDT